VAPTTQITRLANGAVIASENTMGGSMAVNPKPETLNPKP
jgi:hypothetical protein